MHSDAIEHGLKCRNNHRLHRFEIALGNRVWESVRSVDHLILLVYALGIYCLARCPPVSARSNTARIVSTRARADAALSSTATRAPEPCPSFTKSMFSA